jgi:hypothetical protein
MVDIAENEPFELVAGDRWQWNRTDLTADYPASVWTLTYYFTNQTNSFQIVAAAVGDEFAIDQSPATTAAFAAGAFAWEAYAANGSTDRQRVDKGTLVVLPNLAAAGSTDRRSHARKMLDAIEALLENRAAKIDASYSINGRSLSRLSPEELGAWRDKYKAEVAREKRAERIAAGLGHSGKIRARFTR